MLLGTTLDRTSSNSRSTGRRHCRFADASPLAMHVDRRAECGPIPEIAGVIEQEVDATVAAGAADRLLGPPPGEMQRMPEVGEVVREEHVVEPIVVLRADRAGGHRLIRDTMHDRVEP